MPAETPTGAPSETPIGMPAETPIGIPGETPTGAPAEVHTLGSYVARFLEAGLLGDSSDFEGAQSEQQLGVPVLGITYDSREVKRDWLFVCKGEHYEARFLHDALEQGACAFVFETGFLTPDTISGALDSHAALPIEVKDLRAALTIIANQFHDEVWKRITTVGITGTKGKSTTTYYVKSILDTWASAEGRPPTGVLSSIDTFDGVESYESHLTTPEIFELYQHFSNAVNSGISHFVMEVSSQGLKYGRVAGVNFDVGCFLNFGEDHISSIEHVDVEDYLASKLLLFSQCKKAVINTETAEYNRVLGAARAALLEESIVQIDAGVHAKADAKTDARAEAKADAKADDKLSLCVTSVESIREPGLDGLRFTVSDKHSTQTFTLGMTGLFNIENALAAIAIARTLGVPEQHISTGLFDARVPGRMEILHAPNGAVILIDYAHNWMSFERLFASVESEYPNTRRTVLFGCPGYKALGRRRELGTLSGRFCEMTYLTEEDPGEEPVLQICEEIAAFVDAEGGAYTIIADRELAIHTALRDALSDESGNTVVMLTGKGRETRQKRGQEYVPVISDLEIVERYLSNLS